MWLDTGSLRLTRYENECLFFAVKLGIEIRRSSALLRQARANSDDEKSDSRSAISPDEVIMETEVK